MRRLVISIAMLAICVCVTSCYARPWIRGSGHLLTEERSVAEFHALELRGIGRVYVTQGERQELVVTTDDNIMPHLRTDVRSAKLVIYVEPPMYRVTSLEVHVTMVKVRSLALSGSGIIKGQNQIRSDRLDIGISGSGDAELDIMAKEVATRLSGSGALTLHLDSGALESHISGSGKLYLSGQSRAHRFKSSGAGKLYAFDLQTVDTSATISGSGKCEIAVSNHLNVKVSGSGSVRYRGNPKINSRMSGSGRLEAAED